jgi:hypothetical protein
VGTYGVTNRVTSCKACDSGWTTVKPGSSYCVLVSRACPEGSVWTGSVCAKQANSPTEKCPVNTYYDARVRKCISCPAGTVYSGTGAMSVNKCKPCPPGSATFMGKAGWGCSLCPPGSYSWREGQRECTLCDKGTHQPKSGQTECNFNKCPRGTYGALEGSVGATKPAPCKRCHVENVYNQPTGDGERCCYESDWVTVPWPMCKETKRLMDQRNK